MSVKSLSQTFLAVFLGLSIIFLAGYVVAEFNIPYGKHILAGVIAAVSYAGFSLAKK